MSFGWIGPVVALAALGPVDGTSMGRHAVLPEPIVTQRTAFAIPFNLPPANDPQLAPIQVTLSFSRDLGASWAPYGQVAPEKGHFVFQANADGEYWFNIQTRDRAGNLFPRFTGTPGLRVRVDTTPPRAEVSAWRDEGGALTTRWRIEDANFRPNGITLSYRPVGQVEWQDVALGSHHQSKSGDTHLGEVTWWPGQDARAIEIQLQVTDAAINRSVATTRVEMTTADQLTAHPSPRPDSAIEPRPADTYGQSWPAQPHPPLAGLYSPEPAPATVPIPTDDVPADSVPAGHVPTGPVSAGPVPVGHVPAGPGPAGQPTPENTRSVNSRLFELEFDVDASAPSAITHVELWGTRDGGSTWRSMSLHQNGQSPILAKVDAEGVYGFRIVVHGETSVGRPPQPNDPPDIRIRVDLTKPVAHIVSVEEGAGPEVNHLVITWTATDEQLAVEPVSLAYSTQRGGPWTSIAKQLPNTGRFAWPLPDGVKGPIYLRLEVRDAASNTAEFETSEPVPSERGAPKAFIREVRPLGDTSQGAAPRRYIFR